MAGWLGWGGWYIGSCGIT